MKGCEHLIDTTVSDLSIHQHASKGGDAILYFPSMPLVISK